MKTLTIQDELEELKNLYILNSQFISISDNPNDAFIKLHEEAKNNTKSLMKLKLKYFYLLNNICRIPRADRALATLHNFSSKEDNDKFFNNGEYFYHVMKNYYHYSTTVLVNMANDYIEEFNRRFSEDFKKFKNIDNLKKNIINNRPKDINDYTPIVISESRNSIVQGVNGGEPQIYFMIVVDKFKNSYYVNGKNAFEWFVKDSEHFKVKNITLLSGELVARTSVEIISVTSTGGSNFTTFENTVVKAGDSIIIENNCDVTNIIAHPFMEYIDFIVNKGFEKHLTTVLAHINYSPPEGAFILENDKHLYPQGVKGLGGVLFAFKQLIESGGQYKEFLKKFSNDYENYSRLSFKSYYYTDETTFQPNIISLPNILLNGEEFDATQLKFEYGVNVPLNYSSNHIMMDFVYWGMVKRNSQLLNSLILNNFNHYIYLSRSNATVGEDALAMDILRLVGFSQVILSFDEAAPLDWQLELKG